MDAISPHSLSFWIRWVHTVSMGLLLGSTLLMWVDTLRPRAGSEHAWYGPLAERFERFFWLAMGVQVITGIGNMGAFGATLPQPTSAWGASMLLKLALVLGLFLLSLLRTVIVARLSRLRATVTPSARRLGSMFYGATAVLLAGIVLTAVSLAHG